MVNADLGKPITVQPVGAGISDIDNHPARSVVLGLGDDHAAEGGSRWPPVISWDLRYPPPGLGTTVLEHLATHTHAPAERPLRFDHVPTGQLTARVAAHSVRNRFHRPRCLARTFSSSTTGGTV